MITTMLVCAVLGAAGGQNILPNPSFEEIVDGKPAGWHSRVWAGEAAFEVADAGHSGSHSAVMRSENGADTTWSVEIPVKPFSVYKFSGWIKTENVKPSTGEGALFNLHTTPYKTEALTGTHDWTRVELTFETDEQDSVLFNCLLGGWGLATGTAWYDDVSIELIEEGDLDVNVTIDAAKTGEPMSKYIYGQFIEHLGRCIYGGIWAELLEDRKFYYAVGAEESPWRAETEGEGKAEMTKDDPFVGVWAPVLESQAPGTPATLTSAPVDLVPRKKYVGYVWLKGQGKATVFVSDGDRVFGSVDAALDPGQFVKTDFEFTAPSTPFRGALSIQVIGQSRVVVGTASLMPSDNVHGMRADTLELLKQLDAPIYRWPGGNFVSGYDWKDGIGPRDKRPPRKNPAWTGVEHNDFGLDEFIVFCETIGTEPLIVVNSGAGDLELALTELEYANGAADSPMGTWRAKNGHPEPYNVEWWGVGNEMYGDWQIGHMPLEEYVKKHNRFAEAMRAQAPGIKLVAVGATGKWSQTMLSECAEHMDLLSEHFYVQEKKGVSAHMDQVVNAIRNKAERHRWYHEHLPSLQGKLIPIAMDEWNYWYGEHVYGELGTRYFLKDALGIAAGIHEYARNTDVIYMANYAQTVNVIGCIKTTGTDAGFAATGLPLMLYRREFGTIPIAVEGGRPIDVMAAWTDDRKAITIGVVNPLADAQEVPFTLNDATLTGEGTLWTISGDDPMLYNTPGEEQKLVISELPVSGISNSLAVPGYSISLFRLPVK